MCVCPWHFFFKHIIIFFFFTNVPGRYYAIATKLQWIARAWIHSTCLFICISISIVVMNYEISVSVLHNSLKTNLLYSSSGKTGLFTNCFTSSVFRVLMTFTCWVNIWLINFWLYPHSSYQSVTNSFNGHARCICQ